MAETAVPKACCSLCGKSSVDDTRGRSSGVSWECRTCQSLKSMVSRNAGDALAEFTIDDKKAFFKKNRENGEGSRYNWATVRAVLVDQTIKKTIRAQEHSTITDSKPRAVWLGLGYSDEQLDKCPTWTCPILGDVIKVPLHREVFRDIVEVVERRIMEKEQTLRERKSGGKRKAIPEDAAVGDAAHDPDLDVPEAQPKPAGAGPPAKKGRAVSPSAEKKAKQEAKDAAAAGRFNARQKQWAAKAVALLTPATAGAQAVLDSAQKLGVDQPELLKGLSECKTQFAAWAKASTDLLHVLDTGTLPAGALVAALPFSLQDLKDHLKSCNALLKEGRALVKAVKATRAAAKAEASAEAPAMPAAAPAKPFKRRTRGKQQEKEAALGE